LGGAGDTIAVTFTAKKYLRVLATIGNSGTITPVMRFNSDSGNNYSLRYTNDNTTGGSATSNNMIGSFANAATPVTIEADIVNTATTQKFVHGLGVSGSSSAATAPTYFEMYGKWANTTDLITTIAIVNTGGGDFTTGSQVVILGHD
jgi:hypothetical protein